MKSFDADGKPAVFDLDVKAFDRKRKTSKMVLRFEKWQVNGLRQKNAAAQRHEKVFSTQTKNPHHRENSTLNIKCVRTGEIKTIHPRLILKYNGETVIT